MSIPSNYIEVNRALWDAKTKYHATSAFYHMDSDEFINGRSSLNEIELGLLGDVKGKNILHLQCHFGQDTLSLARLGARATGVDFSGEAIKKAEELNAQLGLNCKFICTDIYELPTKLGEQFDIVYTSYGVIGWLPDMKRWAQIVSRYLKPGGKFVFIEFHPMVWMFNNNFTSIQYSYFNKEAIVETLSGTYADRSAPIEHQEIGWNHDLSEVIQALIDAGLKMSSFIEYDHSPYNCFANMVSSEPGKYQIAGLEGKIPMLYSLLAEKV
jgi:SAM-dependent methyltransferase